MSNETEEILKRIQSNKDVLGTIVINSDGVPVKSSMDNATSVQYAALVSQLVGKTRNCVRDWDPSNDLCFLRIRTKKNEIMIAPDKDFTLIVVQSSSD